MLFVYCLETDKNINKSNLPKEVIKHINVYKNKDFKKTSLLAWSFLSKILKDDFNVDLKKEIVLFNKNNKPSLKSKRIHFNLSHSLNLIAIAISDKPVGVDIEKLIPINICKTIAERVLSKSELNKYSKVKDKSKYLTQIWTQKEACVKLIGSTILETNKFSAINTKKTNTLVVYDKLNNLYYLSFTNSK